MNSEHNDVLTIWMPVHPCRRPDIEIYVDANDKIKEN